MILYLKRLFNGLALHKLCDHLACRNRRAAVVDCKSLYQISIWFIVDPKIINRAVKIFYFNLSYWHEKILAIVVNKFMPSLKFKTNKILNGIFKFSVADVTICLVYTPDGSEYAAPCKHFLHLYS